MGTGQPVVNVESPDCCVYGDATIHRGSSGAHVADRCDSSEVRRRNGSVGGYGETFDGRMNVHHIAEAEAN